MKGRDIKGVKKKEKYPFPNCLYIITYFYLLVHIKFFCAENGM